MIKSISFVFLAFMYLFLASCAREKKCLIGGLNLEIINLLENEDDTIQLISFKKNGNFQDTIKLMTYIFVDSLDSINTILNNTIKLYGNTVNFNGQDKNQMGFLSAEYEYKITTKQHSYYFSSLTVLPKKKECGGLLSLECPNCYSPVVQFILNGETMQIIENEFVVLEN